MSLPKTTFGAVGYIYDLVEAGQKDRATEFLEQFVATRHTPEHEELKELRRLAYLDYHHRDNNITMPERAERHDLIMKFKRQFDSAMSQPTK